MAGICGLKGVSFSVKARFVAQSLHVERARVEGTPTCQWIADVSTEIPRT